MCALPRKSYFISIFTSTALKMKFFIKDFFSKCDQMVSVQERGNQFRFKLLVFKERNVHIYTTILCQFKCREYCFQAYMRLVPWVYLHVKFFTTRSCFGSNRTCFAMSRFARILFGTMFSQSLINADLFYFWDRPWRYILNFMMQI